MSIMLHIFTTIRHSGLFAYSARDTILATAIPLVYCLSTPGYLYKNILAVSNHMLAGLQPFQGLFRHSLSPMRIIDIYPKDLLVFLSFLIIRKLPHLSMDALTQGNSAPSSRGCHVRQLLCPRVRKLAQSQPTAKFGRLPLHHD